MNNIFLIDITKSTSINVSPNGSMKAGLIKTPCQKEKDKNEIFNKKQKKKAFQCMCMHAFKFKDTRR